MSRDRQNTLKSAEGLLKQGKVQAALVEMERLAASAPDDLLTLNRMGDLLARSGRTEEAVGYYTQIATKFTNQGFYPKAVAIQKKILRLEPHNCDALIQLGELFVKQKLPGEARVHLLHAAEAMLGTKDFAGAREVYERLVAVEPGDPRHRARLAESRAAEGDAEGAARELLVLGGELLRSGKPEDAEKAFRRAQELLPDHPEPALGIARCLGETGREDEAMVILEDRAGGDTAEPQVLGELLVRYEGATRSSDSAALLQRPRATGIPDEDFRRVFGMHLNRGTIADAWNRLGPVFDGWVEQGHADRLISLYTGLCGLEEPGHEPALERLSAMVESHRDRGELVPVLEWLIRARRAKGADTQALETKLSGLAPASVTPEPEAAPAAASAESVAPPQPRPTASVAPGSVSVEAEAPPVPLNRADQEFVSGRLTQAEILEKYGLPDQALEQVREVTQKFPGHEKAQERLVTLLRGGDDPAQLAMALSGLALARRAGGNTDGARLAAGEAMRTGTLPPEARAALGGLGLLPAAAPTPTRAAAGASDAVISFDDAPAGAPKNAAAAEPARRTRSLRPPGEDMLAEIRNQVRSGELDRAAHNVEALHRLGYGSPALDAIADDIAARRAEIEAQAAAAAPVDEAAEAPAPTTSAAAISDAPSGGDRLFDDDDDLSTITAALESELFADDELTTRPLPESQTEQSLEDVFAAFKQHVEQEVGSDDFRTHYDLGIAYKEMGLTDEAIAEFETAVKAPELFREACAMLAMCHREREQVDEAVRWYREALTATAEDDPDSTGIRYDLADALLQSGDREGALDVFRDLASRHPAYRDVGDRVARLEAASASS